jgi:hypothetical protein
MAAIHVSDLSEIEISAVVQHLESGRPIENLAADVAECISKHSVYDRLNDWQSIFEIMVSQDIVCVRDGNKWVASACTGICPGGDLIHKVGHWAASGDTAQIAILRAYVIDKLGSVVEL